MTLFKQVALAVSVIIILLLSSVMIINYTSSKENMIQTLYETTVNNISMLSSKLAESNNDAVEIKTIIDAEFDSAYYKSIKYVSNSEDFVYKQVDKTPIENVPSWFIKFSKIELDEIKADVSSGWEIMGKVSVVGDASIIYKTLYKMFINLLYLFIVSLSISLITLNILLYFVLKPLKSIKLQAEAILNNQFIIQKKEPYTLEFKELVKAMNIMVHKVEDIFDKANASAKKNHELLYTDRLTKLFNRRYLMLKLPELLEVENKIDGGVSFFISFNNMELLNKKLGHEKVENFLVLFSLVLKDMAKEYEDKIIARVNATEFILILSLCDIDEAKIIVHEINQRLEKLCKELQIKKELLNINFGLYRYKTNITIADLMTKSDNALLKAIAKEGSNSYIYREKDDKTALGKKQWLSIINDAIQNNAFNLKFKNVVDISTKKVEHQIVSFTMKDKEKEYKYDEFIAAAINFDLVSKIFYRVIENLLSKDYPSVDKSLSIHLSNEFLKDINSFERVSEIFSKYPVDSNFKLYFEISNSFATHNKELVKSFVNLFKKYNFGIALYSFTSESDDFSYLKELSLSYIKIDCRFLLDQTQESMNALNFMANSLNIDIIATYVNSQEDMQKLRSKSITKIQGSVTYFLK